MRNKEEWMALSKTMRFEEFVEAVQRDALDAAAEEVMKDATPDSARLPLIARRIRALKPAGRKSCPHGDYFTRCDICTPVLGKKPDDSERGGDGR